MNSFAANLNVLGWRIATARCTCSHPWDFSGLHFVFYKCFKSVCEERAGEKVRAAKSHAHFDLVWSRDVSFRMEPKSLLCAVLVPPASGISIGAAVMISPL